MTETGTVKTLEDILGESQTPDVLNLYQAIGDAGFGLDLSPDRTNPKLWSGHFWFDGTPRVIAADTPAEVIMRVSQAIIEGRLVKKKP